MLRDVFNAPARTRVRTALCGAVISALVLALAAPTTVTGNAASEQPVWGAIQLVVYKSQRRLIVYRHGKPYRIYPVVLGRKPHGRKRYTYDARTPEGYYHITEVRTHARWQYFLGFDYPNAHDRARYEQERRSGRIPEIDGRVLPIGSDVGIHGTDKAESHAAGIDWTLGCIALNANDIQEVVAVVDVGTPLWVLQ